MRVRLALLAMPLAMSIAMPLAMSTTLPACAQEFHAAAFGAATPDRPVCFARVYDAAHLAAHPRQRIADVAIRLVLRKSDGALRLDHTLAVHFKGSRQLYWSGGSCSEFKGLAAECYVEGDGGHATLSLSADGQTLTARFDKLNVWRPQDAADETNMQIDRGPDDKIARLARASLSACKAAGD